MRQTQNNARAIEMEVIPSATGRTLKLADGAQYEFNPGGQLTALVDTAGNRATLQLDSLGYPLSLTDSTGALYRFDRQGAPPVITRITDPAGRAIEFGYDASRRLISYRDQGGGVTLLEYDADNRIAKKTDPRGAVTLYEYDAAGRATQETLPEGGVQRFAYDVSGTLVTQTRHTDENGNTTTYCGAQKCKSLVLIGSPRCIRKIVA